jgi:aldose 1-epimerase
MKSDYSARRTVADGIETVELSDAAHRLEVALAPSLGNMAYEIKAAGKNILWFPYHSPAGFRSDSRLCGLPFLAPWANRIAGDSYWVNGRQYLLNPALGNLRRDPRQLPIHGLLHLSPDWTLVSADASAASAAATSRLEFWKHPRLMAQFPFAHTITMTYRLANAELEVETVLDNLSAEPMPVAIGYHPFFQLDDSPRERWKVHLAAREHLPLNGQLIPTGERRPVAFADPHPLRVAPLDDVFTGLVRGPDGRAHFWVEGDHQRITVTYGPKYPVAVVFAPPAREFVCFEPMAAITNAFNLAHAGVYGDLQNIPPGGQWRESFWIRPSGF